MFGVSPAEICTSLPVLEANLGVSRNRQPRLAVPPAHRRFPGDSKNGATIDPLKVFFPCRNVNKVAVANEKFSDDGGPRSILGPIDDIAVVSRAQAHPRLRIDRVLDKSRASVREQNVDAARVVTLGVGNCEKSPWQPGQVSVHEFHGASLLLGVTTVLNRDIVVPP